MGYYFIQRPERVLDVECYRNYFLVKFKDLATGKIAHVAMHPGGGLNTTELRRLLNTSKLYTFNGNGYDMLVIRYALTGATCEQLKDATDAIINRHTKLRRWEFEETYRLPQPWRDGLELDHIDLMEVAPGVGVSLKMYAGRMHYPMMQDLPYDPAATLSNAMKEAVSLYCDNDLGVTEMMRHQLAPRLELREAMSQKYGVDLRSKSDAQMAESVLRASLDFKPEQRVIPHGYRFKYESPAYIKFVSPQLQALHETILASDFIVNDTDQLEDGEFEDEDDGDAVVLEDGETTRTVTSKGVVFTDSTGEKIKSGVKLPDSIKGTVIQFGHSQYKIGIGGLHSQEKAVSYFTVPGLHTISDHDVQSYYPSLILNVGMFPSQIGPVFLGIFRGIYDDRIAAKAAGASRKTENEGLKIFLNGTFGKLFNKYFVGYAPELGIAVTMTGQLALLMLIERLELAGIAVVSANTDGIVLKVPAGFERIRDEIIRWWEVETGLITEATFYDMHCMANVNNYFSVVTGSGKIKRKGMFARYGMLENKHPDMQVSTDACVDFVTKGVPVDTTVHNCRDIRDFIVVRAVRGGGSLGTADNLVCMQEFKKRSTKARALDKKANPNLDRNDKGPLQQAVIEERDEYAASFRNEGYLGKAVRWYHGTDGSFIATPAGGMVGGSSGAVPIMQLDDQFPDDIDYPFYVDHAQRLLVDLGLRPKPEKKGRKKAA